MSADHGLSGARSIFLGTPSISAITATGSGSGHIGEQVTAAGRHQAGDQLVRQPVQIGLSCSTVRGVNALETSRRIRVWSGGSRSSIPWSLRTWNGSCSGGRCRPPEILVRVTVLVGSGQLPLPQQRRHVRVVRDQPLVGGLVVVHPAALAQLLRTRSTGSPRTPGSRDRRPTRGGDCGDGEDCEDCGVCEAAMGGR